MSEEKNIVILLRQAPDGTLFPVEGLRMAVAVSADFEPITLVINDAVFAFIKDVDKTMYQPHMDFLKEIELEIVIDKKSLDDRGLTKDDLIDIVEIKEHSDILNILRECNVAISF